MALYDARRGRNAADPQEQGWLQRYFADMMRGNQGTPGSSRRGQGPTRRPGESLGDPMLDAAAADAAPETQMEEVISYGDPSMVGGPPAPSMAQNITPPGVTPPTAMGQPSGAVAGGAGGGAAPPAPPAAPPQAGAEPVPSIYEGMTDEQIQEMAGMGDLERQMARAEAMRDQENLKGRYINQGRTYVGDSPIAHAVRGWGIYKGKKEAERLGTEQTAGRRTFIDLLRNRGRPQATASSTEGRLPVGGARSA